MSITSSPFLLLLLLLLLLLRHLFFYLLLLLLFLLLFSFLLIQLPKLFPDLLMELSVSARKVPMFSFLPGEVQLGLPGMVTAFAVQNNATLTPLFKLQAVSTLVTPWDVLHGVRVLYVNQLDLC